MRELAVAAPRGGGVRCGAYARGPGDVPYFASPVLTLVGAWRFSRRPARLVDAGDGAFDGARVIAVESCLGSYGMGGPGFVGIRVRPKNDPVRHLDRLHALGRCRVADSR